MRRQEFPRQIQQPDHVRDNPQKSVQPTCEPAPELECNHEEGNTLIMVLQVLGMLEAGVSFHSNGH